MDIDFEDISNAPMMAFNTRATTVEAKKLVSTIFHLIQQILHKVIIAKCDLSIFKRKEEFWGLHFPETKNGPPKRP